MLSVPASIAINEVLEEVSTKRKPVVDKSETNGDRKSTGAKAKLGTMKGN